MFRDNMNAEYKRKSEEQLKNDLIDQVINGIKVDIPSIMIEREIDSSMQYFESMLKQSRMTLENYVQMTNKHIDDIKAEMKEPAVKRIKRALSLEAIIEKENIEVEDKDIEVELKKWNLPDIKTITDLKSAKSPYNIDSIKEVIQHEEAFRVLIDNAKIVKK